MPEKLLTVLTSLNMLLVVGNEPVLLFVASFDTGVNDRLSTVAPVLGFVSVTASMSDDVPPELPLVLLFVVLPDWSSLVVLPFVLVLVLLLLPFVFVSIFVFVSPFVLVLVSVLVLLLLLFVLVLVLSPPPVLELPPPLLEPAALHVYALLS